MALKKSEKKLLKILGAVLVVSGVILYMAFKPQKIETVESDPDKVQEQKKKSVEEASRGRSGGGGGGSRGGGGGGGSAPAAAAVNLSEFEQHNRIDDCWVLIDGKVYDISSYLSQAASAADAAGYCGTFAFEEGFLREAGSVKDSIIQSSTLKGIIG